MLTELFWEPSTDIKVGAINSAATSFESCLTNMHRAARFMKALHSRRDLPTSFRTAISPKPSFCKGGVEARIRIARTAIHHMDEQVYKGVVPENSPFFPKPDGPEVPFDGDSGQTIKTIDRLVIGAQEISFADICVWPDEMATYAAAIELWEGHDSESNAS